MFQIEQRAHAERIFALLLQASFSSTRSLPDDDAVLRFAEKSIDFAHTFSEACQARH